MKIVVLIFTLALAAIESSAASVSHRLVGEEKSLELSINGTIVATDAQAVARILSAHPQRHVTASLSSLGGDLDAAMKIGRALRARGATVGVWSGQCLSSCVLIYAAGVERYNPAETALKLGSGTPQSTGLGVHRFYFSHLSPHASTAEISKFRNKMKDQIRRYLSEMNVSHSLLDLMESTPPEQMKMLRINELNQVGLTRLDPVHEEKQVAQQAAYFGISSAEFRRRQAAARQHCALQDRARAAKLGTLGDLDFGCEPDFIRSGR
jgi:hypothetical protein